MHTAMGVARSTRHALVLPADEDGDVGELSLDILIAQPASGGVGAGDALILYVLDPEPVLFGVAALHSYSAAGYFANVPLDAPETAYRRLYVVGVGHSLELFASSAAGWDSTALRAVRRRDFPPLDHPAIRSGKGRNAHAKRLAEAFASAIFPHVEAELLGLGGDARPRRALLGASYSSTLALQVLLASPASVDAYILGSPSVPFDPIILEWLREAPPPPHGAPAAFIAYGALEREEPPPPPSSADEPPRYTLLPANVHYRIPDGSHELAAVLHERGVASEVVVVELAGEDHTTMKLPLVSRGLSWLLSSRWADTSMVPAPTSDSGVEGLLYSRASSNNSVRVSAADAEVGRQKIDAFASDFCHEPWLTPGLVHDTPSSRWWESVNWSVRGAIAVMCGMFFVTLPQLEGQNWHTGGVLAPCLAAAMFGMAPVRCCGAVMMLGRLFATGALMGAVISCIVVEASRQVANPGELHQGRDLLCMVLLCTAISFLYSRPNLHSAHKKLGGVIAGLATGSVTYRGYVKTNLFDEAYPFKFLFPIVISCVLVVLAMLLPLPGPRLAVLELRKRLQCHVHLVHAVLYTNLYIKLTQDASHLHNLVALVEALEKNAQAMKPLYMFSCVEICLGIPWPWACFFRRQRSTMARLGDMVKMCGACVQPLRKTVMTVQATVIEGKLLNSQAAYLSVSMESLKDTMDAFTEVLDLSVQTASTSNLAASKQCEAKLTVAKEHLNRAMAEWTKHDKEGDARSVASAQLEIAEANDLIGKRRTEKRYINRVTGFKALSELFKLQPPDFVSVEASVAKRPPFAPKELLKWLRAFLTGRPTGQALQDTVKNSLAVVLVSCFIFIHALRFKDPDNIERVYVHNAPHWALVTASFVIAEGGSSLPICVQRVKGTFYGSTYALLIAGYILIGFEDGGCSVDADDCWRTEYGHKLTLVMASVPFQLIVGLFGGYEVTTAALTSPLLLALSVGRSYTDAYLWAVYRIKETVFGVLAVLAVQSFLWPRSAQTAIRDSDAQILGSLAAELTAAYAPFSQEAKSAVKVEALVEPAAPDTVQLATKALGLMPLAREEPVLWRQNFSSTLRENALRLILQAAHTLKELKEISSNEQLVNEFPAEVKAALAHMGQLIVNAVKSFAAEEKEKRVAEGADAGPNTLHATLNLGLLDAVCDDVVMAPDVLDVAFAAHGVVSHEANLAWCTTYFCTKLLCARLTTLEGVIRAILAAEFDMERVRARRAPAVVKIQV